jgi:hypothetical protein
LDVVSILESVSITVAAWTAVWGINAWRREFVGKKRIELAEEVLTRFYEARDVIRLIRNPFGLVGEGGTRQRGDNESPEESQILDNAYVVFERYNKNQEVFNQLRALRYRFIAQFGPDATLPFDDLFGAVNDIFVASRMLTRHWMDQGRRPWRSDEEFQEHLRRMHENESVFWEMSRVDATNQKIDRALSQVEEICRGEIQQGGRARPRPLEALSRRLRSKKSKKADAKDD